LEGGCILSISVYWKSTIGIFMGNKVELLGAKDKDELLRVLDRLSFPVPRRDQGRKTEHAEKYSIYRFLMLMAKMTGYVIL
jgi:hypothetical protein